MFKILLPITSNEMSNPLLECFWPLVGNESKTLNLGFQGGMQTGLWRGLWGVLQGFFKRVVKGNLKWDLEGTRNIRVDLKQDLVGEWTCCQAQVRFRLQLKFNSLELDTVVVWPVPFKHVTNSQILALLSVGTVQRHIISNPQYIK